MRAPTNTTGLGRTSAAVAAGVLVTLMALSCDVQGGGEIPVRSESHESVARIAELQARFRVPVSSSERATGREARVELPRRASDMVRVEDERSHVAVRFALDRVYDAPIATSAGIALYASALDGNDVLQRVHAAGVEDYVVFETRPAHEELSYVVDVSRVAGLRLVSNTLELLDEAGAPRLRVEPPYVVDAEHVRHVARLAVDGCAYDTHPAGPWGRKLTPRGAERCTVRVRWSNVAYPAMVDPAWTTTGNPGITDTINDTHTATLLASGRVLLAGAGSPGAALYDPDTGTFAVTGSMGAARTRHTASLLPSGAVLVAGGGITPNEIASAEIYDPTAGTFSPTGSLTHGRGLHTATVLASGSVLVAGGVYDGSAEIYDTVLGTFAATGSMRSLRSSHTATLLGSGKVLVAGGIGPPTMMPLMAIGSPYLSGAELYDPAAGTFADAGAMGSERGGHTASLLSSGEVLVVGGSALFPAAGLSSLAGAELYDPVADSFFATGSMPGGRTGHGAVVLPSGKVLVVAGRIDGVSTSLASVVSYDPGSATFSVLSPLNVGRSGHTTTALVSGNVLVVGGRDKNGSSPPAEVFAPVATGQSCQSDSECASNSCDEHVCCFAPCAGECSRCAPGGNTCVAVTNADDKNSCTDTRTCNSVGECKLKDGQPCTSDAMCLTTCLAGQCKVKAGDGGRCKLSEECTSGFCADGTCCSSPCTGGCEACDASPGTCVAIAGKPHGSRLACPPENECSATTGRCEPIAVPPIRATCDRDHTVTLAEGTTQDCTPYKCDVDATCRNACTSVNDCVAPFVCETSGTCALPPHDSGVAGCTVGRRRGGDDALAFSTVAFFALLMARRKRRGARAGGAA